MKVLRDFIHRFDFVRMHPDGSVFAGGLPDGVAALAMVEPGKAIAVFVRGGDASTVLRLTLPPGTWAAEWIDTRTGAVARTVTVNGGGERSLSAPPYAEDIALRLVRP